MSASSNLPGGIEIASDEQVIDIESFKFGFIQFLLQTKVVLTNRRLAAERPNVILGLIPIGTNKLSFPLENIASVGSSFEFGLVRFLLGVILAIIGLAVTSETAGGLIFLLAGVIILMGAFRYSIQVTNNAGQTIILHLIITQIDRARRFTSQVNTTLANRQQ